MNVSPSGDPRKRVKELTKGSSANASIFMGCPPHSTKKKKKITKRKEKKRKEREIREKKESRGKKEKDRR